MDTVSAMRSPSKIIDAERRVSRSEDVAAAYSSFTLDSSASALRRKCCVLFVVKGKARMRQGDDLEFMAEAGPGDFIYVPPYVPHQEINANPDEPLSCVLVRSDQEPVAVNLDIDPAEPPEEVYWEDPIHTKP